MEIINRDLVLSVFHFANPGWCMLPSAGASGGILMIWDLDQVVCDESWVDVHSVSVAAVVCGED